VVFSPLQLAKYEIIFKHKEQNIGINNRNFDLLRYTYIERVIHKTKFAERYFFTSMEMW